MTYAVLQILQNCAQESDLADLLGLERMELVSAIYSNKEELVQSFVVSISSICFVRLYRVNGIFSLTMYGSFI